ncbi:MAG: response regulator [Planctomycetales bacterium]
MNKIRVMLVDDHNVLRSGLRMLIDAQLDMEVVAEADNSGVVLDTAAQFQPDVLVLDLSLPGGPSLPVIEKLSACGATPRVLVLTMHDDPAYVRAALGAGAKGYVVKTIGERDLLEAIRAVQRGRLVVDLDDAGRTASVFQNLEAQGFVKGILPATRLSHREAEVLRLLGRGFSNQEVAQQLDLSPKTVATYRARIGEKLGLKTTAEFVKYAADTGTVGPQPE